ncbi:MAG: SusD/RagB family nutrient-binding outer membrane lipoprotein, partial [Bacteroidales bacterium]|nr:SusD/RagB family nutrient-binding outer membrane lipoprotein [Bacteroidales bacterium]
EGVDGIFQTQDFVNHGSIDLWRKYCNSLRIRMLMRVSGVASFQSRVNSEMTSIVGNSNSYPVCATNDDNILITVTDLSSSASSDLYDGIIGWGDNDHANKMMIDTLQNNGDPRLRAMFQPGALSAPLYVGLDPMLDKGIQASMFDIDTIARYNYSTISKNKMLPGILITSAATQLLIADYYLNIANNNTAAKIAYETGIKNSIEYYYWLRSISDNGETNVDDTNETEISAYLASNMAWDNAITLAQKQNLVALQKWINYSILEPLESWSEIRRTNLPVLNFVVDNSSAIAELPPSRFTYSTDEITYNTENYNKVKANDNLNVKIFWDVN